MLRRRWQISPFASRDSEPKQPLKDPLFLLCCSLLLLSSHFSTVSRLRGALSANGADLGVFYRRSTDGTSADLSMHHTPEGHQWQVRRARRLEHEATRGPGGALKEFRGLRWQQSVPPGVFRVCETQRTYQRACVRPSLSGGLTPQTARALMSGGGEEKVVNSAVCLYL